ncbi:hypothetical protein D3C72_2338730 [compost metagenome]
MVTLIIADIVHLVETGNRVAHMGCIFQRQFALVGEGEFIIGQCIAVPGIQFTHGNLPDP